MEVRNTYIYSSVFVTMWIVVGLIFYFFLHESIPECILGGGLIAFVFYTPVRFGLATASWIVFIIMLGLEIAALSFLEFMAIGVILVFGVNLILLIFDILTGAGVIHIER